MGKIKLPTHVHQNPNRHGKIRYYYQYRRGKPDAGPRNRLPDNPHSPEFWAALNRHRYAEQAGTSPSTGLRKTIERMVADYIASPHFNSLAASTRREYVRYLQMISEGIGNEHPDALEPHDVARIRDNIGIEKPGKANAMVRVIGALFVWGRERGWCKMNPADGIKKLRGGEWQPWTPFALAAIDKLRPDIAFACRVALHTGQRMGDVIAMSRSAVQGAKIFVRQEKTGKELLIPLHPEIRHHIATGTGCRVCWKQAGDGDWTTEQFEAAFQRERAKVDELKGVVFHGLRKNAAVKLAEVGCTTHEIASITGMSLPMVEHYTRGVRQALLAERAMEKVQAYKDVLTTN
jgi:integrase